LHPLLEDGYENEEQGNTLTRVGFIGISNWALDPAKMNRGILVQRGVPNVQELADTAREICAKNEVVQKRMQCLVRPLAQGYQKLCQKAAEKKECLVKQGHHEFCLSVTEMKEFFGLRDFYR